MDETTTYLLIETIDALAKPTYFDWINLLVSSVAVIVSAFAIYFAILVPRTLANQKNRISLFEKRYSLYLLLLDLHGVLQSIKNKEDCHKMEHLVEVLEQLRRQQGMENHSEFFNLMVTALNSPKYFFSFDIEEVHYHTFYQGMEKVLLAQRGFEVTPSQTEVEGIFENLEFFHQVVRGFESYFYICPPKKK